MNGHNLTKYTWIGYTAVRSHLAYVSEVISRTTFMAVILYIFMKLWTAVYAGSGSNRLGGLTLCQMIWYLMITESIAISTPRVASEIDEDVRTGRLAVQLLRPLSYAFARMAQTLGERSIRFAVNFLTGTVVVLLLVGPIPFRPTQLAMFLFVLPLAFVIDFLGYFSVGLCAFWFESTTGLTLIYSRLTMLLGGMLLPLEVFPEALQTIARWLPFASVLYGPARIFVSGSAPDFAQTVANQALALALLGATVAVVQTLAVKHVQSNGG
jgi:ABC-2 type transport system permease protein